VQSTKQFAPLELFSHHCETTGNMSSTEIVSNETGKDIDKKMDTMNTVPLGTEKTFDDEAEAIAVTTDHAGEPMRWGKGIVRDFKRTIGTNWIKEMTNFNQKTVAVTVSDPLGVHSTNVNNFHSPASVSPYSSSSTLPPLLPPLHLVQFMAVVQRITWEQSS
jgi:hypothetical protein